MTTMLTQHWTTRGLLSVVILAALCAAVSVSYGLKLRRSRRAEKQRQDPVRTLFPKKSVFLIEKHSAPGCARPCATGPLFQFDSSEKHASLDIAEGYKTYDIMNGHEGVPLFAPGWDYGAEPQPDLAARYDGYLPPADPTMTTWKRDQMYDNAAQLHHQFGSQHASGMYSQPQQQQTYYDTGQRDRDFGHLYGRTESGEDDSDSGLSLPLQKVEPLELVDPINMGPMVEDGSDITGLHHMPSFVPPPVSSNDYIGSIAEDPGIEGLVMPYEKPLEPLDPDFEIEQPRSLLSERLRNSYTNGAAQPPQGMNQRRQPPLQLQLDKNTFMLDPNHMPYNETLPLSNPAYSVGDFQLSADVDSEQQDGSDSASYSMAFSHLSSPESEHFSPDQIANDSRVPVPKSYDSVSMGASTGARRKMSTFATAVMKKDRSTVRRKPFQLSENMNTEFPLGLSVPLTNSSLPGSFVPATTSDVEVASSVGSNGLSPSSPKSPKDTEFISSDDGAPRYRCPHCDTTFRIRGYLTRHIKKHADVMMYNCPFFNPDDEHRCHATGGFSRRDTYKTHLKARHFLYPRGTNRKERFRMPGNCSGCGESFSNNEEWIETHIQPGLCSGKVSNKASGKIMDTPPDSSHERFSEEETEQNLDKSKALSISLGPEIGPARHGGIEHSLRDYERNNVLVTHVQ